MTAKMLLPILALLLALPMTTLAQEGQVYVTVQDQTALRAGPGTGWNRLAVLPFGTTYRAVGRTVDGDWIQIAYEGQLEDDARPEFTIDGVTYGWVASWLLIWSGDVLDLPIDGVVAVPIARAAGPTIVIGPQTRVYRDVVDPSTLVPSPASSPVTVEVTGRLGSTASGYFWLQFKMAGHFYWTASWEVGVPRGYSQLPDAAYLYPYSRLTVLLRQNLEAAHTILYDIGGRWRALDSGQTTTCNDIPDDVNLPEFRPTDLRIEPVFAPTALALETSERSINAALALFRTACADPTLQVSADMTHEALMNVEVAERNFALLGYLLGPIQRRDPVLGNVP